MSRLLAVALTAAVLVLAGCGGDEPDSRPVLLLPGYGGSPAGLMDLAATLEEDGRTAIVVPLAAAGTDDLRDQVALVDAAAQEALDDNDSDSVDVVGFSAGGLVARLWVAGGGAPHRVVTLATPNHGTELVLGIDDCPPACQQLGPGSDVMLELNDGDETPDGTQWVTIWSDGDDAVLPPESARLDGALDITIQSVCPGLAIRHTDTPDDPAVVAMVSAVLAGDEAGVPENVDC
jgi:triacylglycerol lipase